VVIINKTKNTIHVEDLDIYLQYQNGNPEELDVEIFKKSRALRTYIINNDEIEIVEYNPREQMEVAVAYAKEKTIKRKKNIPKKYYTSAVEAKPVGNEIEVKIHGLFYDASGYGKVNRNLALGLDKVGFKVKIDPKRSVNQLNEDELRPVVKLEKTQLSKKHVTINSVVPTFSEISSGKYQILYTTIESYTVPDQFLECCKMYHEIWTTNCWSATILRKYIKNIPIYAIPVGTDQTLYTEKGPKFDFKPNIKDFVFISVFGWGYRKGYDVLLKAFFEEFDAKDNVSLLLVSRYHGGTSKTHRNRVKEDIDKIIRQYPNRDLPHLVRYSQIVKEEDMPLLYRSADCFVICSRGEGSNLCAPEASLCGLPVIMTNCSGQQVYLRDDNAFLIDIDRLQIASTGQFGVHYWDGQKFPALTDPKVINQTRKHMRYVYTNHEEAKEKNKNLQKLILDELTWNNTINAATERLKKIHAKLAN